jgi:UDP-N-acetylmuramate dehydrogenase
LSSVDPQLLPSQGVMLATLSTLGIGGPARWFARATTVDDVAAADAWAAARGTPLFVLGGGSNLVIADEGVNGLVLQIAMGGVAVSGSGTETLLKAAAGESWDGLVASAVGRGLAGIECLSGIPGSVGGTPIQNVGAYGQEVSRVIETLTAYDRREHRLVQIDGSECGFGYRTSRFKERDAGRFVICDVTFRLRAGPPTITYRDLVDQLAREEKSNPDVADARAAVLTIRRRKGMVIDTADPATRSVGSFFTNPVLTRTAYERVVAVSRDERVPCYVMQNDEVKIPAAWLIEQAGFHRGRAEGPVGLSTKHPLALVNRGGATARQLLEFAGRIKRAVIDRFGVALRPEPVFVGFSRDADVDFLLDHS